MPATWLIGRLYLYTILTLLQYFSLQCYQSLFVQTAIPAIQDLDHAQQNFYDLKNSHFNTFIAQISCEYDQIRVTNVIQIKHYKLRIPTGGRLTSWLFTKRGGVESGTTKHKLI